MENINTEGSIWRKWDLHIHSNASDGKGTSREIIDKAIEQGLAVIALTDHHTVKNIDEIKELGKEKGVVVISGIEFRTEYGNKSVHMIGLFPDIFNNIKLTQSALMNLVLAPLELSETTIITKGREEHSEYTDEQAYNCGLLKVQVDFKKAADLIHKYGGIVTVHAGDKTNTIEQMKHEGNSASNVHEPSQSLGPVKDELMKEYIDICEVPKNKDAEFYLKVYNTPSIAASDAHEISEIACKYTWIKADTTFEGLRQILYEPEDRVKIQETEPEGKSDYQVIEAIKIDQEDFGNQYIPFNSNLNVIIGGRSSGKSILLGCLAKLANYNGDIKVENEKYSCYINSLLSNMSLVWRDKSESEIRKVEYFPQSFINKLASDSGEIKNLIENILKGDEAKKLRYEKYNGNVSENKVAISNEIENFYKLQYRLEEINAEIENIGSHVGINKEIEKLEKEIEEVKAKSTTQLTEEEEKSFQEKQVTIENCNELIKTQNKIVERLTHLLTVSIIREITTELVEIDENLKMILAEKFNLISSKFSSEWKAEVQKILDIQVKIREQAKSEIDKIINEGDYLKCVKYFETNQVYTNLDKRLKIEKIKMSSIKELYKNKLNIENELKKSKIKLIDLQRKFKTFGDELCSNVSLYKEDVKIVSSMVFSQNKYTQIMDSKINKRAIEASKIVNYVYEDCESFYKILEDIFNKIIEKKLTLKSGFENRQIIMEILSSDYFDIKYDVEYQGDTLSSMSEGKKAFIILRLLLDFSDNLCPILIDQPEDDLDNRAIFTELVSYLRTKKKERQIIVVTHNPNIVVGADAEVVIIANQNGVKSENQDRVKFEYLSGALENTKKKDNSLTILLSQGVREHVCEILEGGDVAFKKREMKYQL